MSTERVKDANEALKSSSVHFRYDEARVVSLRHGSNLNHLVHVGGNLLMCVTLIVM